MHLAPLIRDLAIILAIAGCVTLLFQKIRQPVVLGYIVAGLIVGPHTPPFPLVTDIPNVKTLADLGVIFLMFSLGLEFSFRKFTRVGITAGFTAIYEVTSMIFMGFITGQILGWSKIDSIFLGAMISISSTTIIIKALDELNLKARRFAEMVLGILIVEDLCAILILVTLTTFASVGHFSTLTVAHSLGRLILIVGSWFLTGFCIVPRFVRYVASFQSDEILAVVAISLCLGLSAISAYFQYSPALGAFIMGSILAESTESSRIEELLKPVRDIFGAIFFVSVGMLIDPSLLWQYKGIIFFLSILIITGKLIHASIGPALTGQPLKTSILIGCSLGQIGEFSFIIASLGITLKTMSPELYPIIVAASLVTTFTTPYLIRWAPRIANRFEKALPPKFREAFAAFSTWRTTQPSWTLNSPEIKGPLLKWITQAFVVILITISMVEYGVTALDQMGLEKTWIPEVTWVLTLILASPFLWSMIQSFPHRPLQNVSQQPRLAPLLGSIFTGALLSLLSLFFFDALPVGLATVFLFILLSTRNMHHLERYYHWLENSFLSVFKEQQKNKRRQSIYRQLAPWDGHLVRIKVHSNSEIAGRKIFETQFRNRFGINIVAIQRGSQVIIAPKPDYQIFPKDELLLLGTDEQIEKIRNTIESPRINESPGASIESYEVRRIFLEPQSTLHGKKIRDLGLRENFSSMVVGIERQGTRIMNPHSDLVIESQDILSLVGESHDLDRFVNTLKK